MRKISLLLSIFCLTMSLSGQNNNPDYDSTLAKQFGADEYGMKMYVIVVLKTGPRNVTDKAERDSLFTGHQRNIRKLAEQKKLIVAGPFDKNDKAYRGIFILDVSSFEEARSLLEADPTIREKVFDPEFYNWYGSAALPEYLRVSNKIWKKRP